MAGYYALVLHAHLPYVRHPEHDRFLEENWLFEAITETYLPLLQVLEGWAQDGMDARLSLTLTPTLNSMLQDPLLQDRYRRYLEGLVELAEKETYRTHWQPDLHALATLYHRQFERLRHQYQTYHGDLVRAFARLQDHGQLEIITSAATHAFLPLLESHPPSIRAQILVARDHYQACFGREPRGIWLPECAYVPGIEPFLQEVNIRWFVTEAHGLLHAQPRPRYGVYAPIFTPNALAVFGRDLDSAKQVWSKQEGYPGDAHYRDFYRDIGYDLDYDYLQPYLPAPPHRSFTGIKYFAITGRSAEKTVYQPEAALRTADAHAHHFLGERMRQISHLGEIMEQPPVVLSAYDAELFGHWWYEGPRFLDLFVRKAYYDQRVFQLTTPDRYLHQYPTHQVARPSPSSWGEGGYWRIWLNEKNEWIYPHLQVAQERMSALARRFPQATGLIERGLKQAARELLLAQSSDWPFILRTGTSPEYATRRVNDHVARFNALFEQLTSEQVDGALLQGLEEQDNIFPAVDYRYWA